MSEDEQQDRLVRFFNLEPGDAGYSETLVETIDPTLLAFSKFSSNPAALDNFHFPVMPGSTGYVSLDFNETHRMF